MQIGDFLGISIVGVFLSSIVEVIKLHLGPTSGVTKVLTVMLAVIIGSLYWWLASTVWWTTILGVLASASTVYALFWK